jgi:Uma2 family endonuclease
MSMSLLPEKPDSLRFYRLSPDTYHRLGELGLVSEDVELLRGIIIQKISKSPLHHLILRAIARKLVRSLPESFDVRTESPITTRDSEPEPDISVVEWRPEERRLRHSGCAHLVVEVSVTTREADEEKAGIYAEAGIAEYWLVRPDAREVDVMRGPSAAGYSSRVTFRESDILRPVSLPGVELSVGEIFSPRA